MGEGAWGVSEANAQPYPPRKTFFAARRDPGQVVEWCRAVTRKKNVKVRTKIPSTLIAELMDNWRGYSDDDESVPEDYGVVLRFLSAVLHIGSYMPGDLENDCIGSSAVNALKRIVRASNPEPEDPHDEKVRAMREGAPLCVCGGIDAIWSPLTSLARSLIASVSIPPPT